MKDGSLFSVGRFSVDHSRRVLSLPEQARPFPYVREENQLEHTENINLPVQKSMQRSAELGRRGKIHIYVSRGNSFVIVDNHSAGKQTSWSESGFRWMPTLRRLFTIWLG